ncbi:MAG: response regulator, partial [Symploca sp. SIO2B6]|nr:response regulator [Symploca sp. SIO2B6]
SPQAQMPPQSAEQTGHHQPIPSQAMPSQPISSHSSQPIPSQSINFGEPGNVPLVGKLLVVDDNEANRDMFYRRLKRKGHTVVTASSGEEAMAIVQQTRVDVILLDVMMPGMDGFETLRQIRQTYSQLQLPVIMVTAKVESQDMVQAFEWGANDYVTKPIDFDLAIARIQNQLLAIQAMRRQSSFQPPAASPRPSAPSSPTVPSSTSPSISTPLSPTPTYTNPLSTPSSTTSFRANSGPEPSSPPSFRPPAPIVEMKRDRLADRYEILQVLTDNPFSQLLIAKDIQQPGQPLYFLKRLNASALPLSSNTPSPIEAMHSFLSQEIPRLQTMSRHSHITTFIDTFEHEGSIYLVQEFVDGDLLADELQTRSPLPFTQVVPLFKDLFETLEFLHRQQIIHGELHSRHLMRRRSDDQLMLIDFGAAQRMLAQLTSNGLTETGYIQGYMPPEQYTGTLLFSSDVYALGMLILYALTGKTPEHITRNRVTGELQWRELTNVDDKTAAVIQKMIYQDYASRYAYPEEASKDLLFQWYTLRFKRTLS